MTTRDLPEGENRLPALGEVTALLQRSSSGDPEAVNSLFQLLYAELHHQAQGQRSRWEGNHTLNTTALVHEAYVKLIDQGQTSWNDRAHFMAVATRAMRHILINYAELRRAAKRGGGREPESVENANPLSEEAADEVLALHDALERLEAVHERQARVVEARFFGGFSIEETGSLLGISPATVKRDWVLAAAWLHREVQVSLD
ncbi:sigma-70 family RNA polymerase sigma factor [Gemmatimonadota bacterium]